MSEECQSIIDMLMSTDKESRYLAEKVIEQLIISKNNDIILECLRNFLERDIYNKYNPFKVTDECFYIRDRIRKYLDGK